MVEAGSIGERRRVEQGMRATEREAGFAGLVSDWLSRKPVRERRLLNPA
jgi:hypothetical protein